MQTGISIVIQSSRLIEAAATLAAAARPSALGAIACALGAVALLAQPNDAQPGRLRPDAPAQHEAARKNIPHLGS